MPKETEMKCICWLLGPADVLLCSFVGWRGRCVRVVGKVKVTGGKAAAGQVVLRVFRAGGEA